MSFRIYVKTLTGKTISLDVEASNTVADIKQKIHTKEGIPTDQQRIIYAGKDLGDSTQSISDIGMTKDSVVHLVLRMRG